MARVTIVLEDDQVPENPLDIRQAQMSVKVELTEDEKDLPPSIAVISAHHFRHLWTEQGIPLGETQKRIDAEIAARKEAPQGNTPAEAGSAPELQDTAEEESTE